MIIKIFFTILIIDLASGDGYDFTSDHSFEAELKKLKIEKEEFFKAFLPPHEYIHKHVFGNNLTEKFHYDQLVKAVSNEDCDKLFTEWRMKKNGAKGFYPDKVDFFDEFCKPLLYFIKKCQQSMMHHYESLIKIPNMVIDPTENIFLMYKLIDSTCFYRGDIWLPIELEYRMCKDYLRMGPIRSCPNVDLKMDKALLIPADEAEKRLEHACNTYATDINCYTAYYQHCKQAPNLYNFYHKYNFAVVQTMCKYAIKTMDFDEDYFEEVE